MKPSIPKGTRDFSAAEMARRNYIFDTIKTVFRLFGFSPIETPSMENLSTLMGKYGEEGDKLLFKVLNSGDFMRAADPQLLQNPEGHLGKLTSQLCEKGLRYDLTVPFARFVVMHRNELQMPFKRYQMQPVWRADRPQKGRYREFYQCDADIVGSDSLLNEVDLIRLIDEVFARLGIRVAVKLNNRKILSGIASLIGADDKIVDITVAIDKIDKIGLDGVKAELHDRGLSDSQIATMEPVLAIDGTVGQRLDKLAAVLAGQPEGLKGVDELRFITSALQSPSLRCQLDLDVSLARGLNYYTGAIIEVKALDVQIGSITGGGRYDNLTGVFGMPGLSGVGISFGADRIYDVMNQLELYPDSLLTGSKLLMLNMGAEEAKAAMTMTAKLRQAGIPCELYPDQAKMKKQMGYADALRIPFVGIVGESEMQQGMMTLKNMATGEQTLVTVDRAIELLA